MSKKEVPGEASWGAGRVTAEAEARFVEGVAYCERFFMGQAGPQKALYRLTSILRRPRSEEPGSRYCPYRASSSSSSHPA